MRILRLALMALFAVFALSAMATTSASAFHPLWLTASGKELLFSGLGKDPILRGETLGQQANILCEKLLIHGFVLHLSTLAHRILITLEGKCVHKVNGGPNEACVEPIKSKYLLAELGLLTATNHKVVILLRPSDGTNVFFRIECGGQLIEITNVVVGEIPAAQINVPLKEIEWVFETINKTNQQSITEIFLLGEQMVKQELFGNVWWGGKAALEVTIKLVFDGVIEITTTKL